MELREQRILLDEPPGRYLRYVLSVSASVVVSFLILLGITQAKQTDAVPDEPAFEDIRSIVLPSPPPPPPTAVREAPLPPSLHNLELPVGESSMKISISPTPITPASHPPSFQPDFDFSPDSFRPSSQSFQRRYVYRKSEVDQPPIPVYKKVPGVNLNLMGDRRYAKVSLMYIVNKEGEVEGIKMWGTGGEAFDQAVLEGVRQWRFKPALKGGERVNCWVRQNVVVNPGNMGSPLR